MRLMDTLILKKEPALSIEINTDIINQNIKKNLIIGLLGTLILGE